MTRVLAGLLIMIFAVLPVWANADMHQFHQSGVDHQTFDHEQHELGKDSYAPAIKKHFSDDGGADFDLAAGSAVAPESENPYDCHHCCHCHHGAQSFLTLGSENITDIAFVAILPGFSNNYPSLILSPALRPPIA